MKQFQFVDFQVQAAEIVDRARQDAEQILRDARTEADRIRERARVEGLTLAREEAAREDRKLVVAATQRVIDQIVALMRDVDARRDALVAEAERDLVKLAVAIAERVVKGELKSKKRVAEANVGAAVALAGKRQSLVARVHPDDLKLIELPRLGPVTLQADPSVERGGCVLEMAPGEIDMQIKTQLEQIEKGLLE